MAAQRIAYVVMMERMKKRMISVLLVLSIILSMFPAAALADSSKDGSGKTENPFSDVSKSDWFYESVMYALNHDLFSGITADEFDPQGTMTRAMYVTVMGRMAEIDPKMYGNTGDFQDVEPNSWYGPYVAWAAERGITSGVGGKRFDPMGLITREQMAAMTVRFFDAYQIKYPSSITSTTPADADSISDFAQSAVAKLWNCGLFQGDSTGKFNPQKNAHRAEAAAFCTRADEFVEQWLIEIGKKKDPKSRVSYTYYQITFESNGGSKVDALSRMQGAVLNHLPVPYKENSIFHGWCYDSALERPVSSRDILMENMTLYAKWGDTAPPPEDEKQAFARTIDTDKNFVIKITAPADWTVYQLRQAITVKNVSSNEEKEWISVKKEGAVFVVSGVNYNGAEGAQQPGFIEGANYKLTLKDDGLAFVGQDPTARIYDFTIKKTEVMNVSLNQDMIYISIGDLSNLVVNGAPSNKISIAVITVGPDGSTTQNGAQTVGSFTYTKKMLKVGDSVGIYEGQKIPTMESSAAGDEMSFVEITAVSGSSYSYKGATMEEVLFMPDVLPVSEGADKDGNRSNLSITVSKETMTYTDDKYANLGLTSQTTVDAGDFLAFYTGNLGDNGSGAAQSKYAKIETVAVSGSDYIIGYALVTQAQMMEAMSAYRKEQLEGDELLEGVDKKAVERSVEQQARDSGFAQEAGMYLAAMALETDSFTEVRDDFDLSSYSVKMPKGVSQGEIAMARGSKAEVDVDVTTLQATISTHLVHFENLSGLRLTLTVGVEVTIHAPKGDIVITITGSFEQEVKIDLGVDGCAVWKWWFIFPYIAEYKITAWVDLYSFTGIGINATMVTKEADDGDGLGTGNETIEDIGKQIKDLMDEKDKYIGDGEGTVATTLQEKYAAMLENESDWVELFSKDIFKQHFRIILIIDIEIKISFIVTANMNISLGLDFWYENAKRYLYSVEIFSGKVTNETIDLVEEHYEFEFYVMGTMGLRAGVKAEIAVGLFSTKLASVGFGAEAGVYVRVWGYFYYQLIYRANSRPQKTTHYAGALLFELGIYLEITFLAQVFNGTFSYNPTLYEKEWPMWSAGMQENIRDFAYESADSPELKLKKAIKTTYVPDSLFEMAYLDLKTGEDEAKIFADSTKYFTIQMTNHKFSYDRATNRLTVTPTEKDFNLDGEMIVTWVNQPLAFSSAAIQRRMPLHWDNLNDGYALVFHSGGGSSVPIIIGRYGAAIRTPQNPVKKGYVFDGWYSDEALKTPYAIPETMPNVDVECYAKWTPATDTPYRVEHYSEVLGSSQYRLLETENLKGTTDSSVSAATKSYPGHVAPEGKVLTIFPDGSTILRYYYDLAAYTLSFQPGIAQGEDSVTTLKYGATITPPTFSSKGYAFTGWDKAPAATMPAKNLTYTAQWTAAADTPYRVEYYVEQLSGRYTLQTLDDSKTGKTGGQVDISGLINAPDHQYAVENGIAYRDVTISGEATTAPVITKDGKLVIKVNYERLSHDAVFKPENGKPDTVKNVKYEGTITAPETDPEKQGYDFAGWTGFTTGATMGKENISYTAAWTPRADTAYTVKHIREDLKGNYPNTGDLVELESKTGTTQQNTAAEAKEYEGFTAGAVTQTKILPDGSVVVEVRYSRNSYTVNWIAEGATHKTQQVKYGATLTPPTEKPTKQGYVFASWQGFAQGATMGIVAQSFTATWTAATNTAYTVKHLRADLNGGYTIVETTTEHGTTEEQTAAAPKTYEGFAVVPGYAQTAILPDGSSVVEIQYTRNRYTITWLANNAIHETTLAVQFGAEITPPAASPTNKNGYTFKKWLNVPATMPAKDVSYQADWTANQYTVTFDVNGGTAPAENTKVVTYDSAYGALPVPTYTGYRFVNWTNSEGATVSADSVVKTAGAHTLTATWAAETAIAYQVKHHQQNILDDNYTQFGEAETQYGETDTDTAAVQTSYEGFTMQPFAQEKIAGDGTTVVNIYYNRNQHDVTWDISGAVTTQNYRYGATIAEPVAVRTGYSFNGWNTTVASAMPDSNLSYTAQWKPNTYTVSFDENGGSPANSITVTYDSTYPSLPTSARTGYTFAGWFTAESGGTKVLEGVSVQITANQTLHAQWSANAYLVSFDLNTGEGPVPTAISVTYNSSYAGLPSATKTGYTFVGWYTAAGGGTVVTDATTLTTANDHTLHAHWTANTYTVLFDGNGSDGGSTANQTLTYDKTQTLTANGYTKTGHNFAGWNTAADGSGTAYPNSASVLNLDTDGSITLYAQWTVNQYTISFDSAGGSAVTAITQAYGSAVTPPTAPTSAGYIFTGWQKGGVAYSFTTMPAENINLTAIWTAVTYAITYELYGSTNAAGNPKEYSVETGAITLADPSGKTGYTFDGWYTDGKFTPESKVIGIAIANGSTGAKAFYAHWTANPYTVTFHKNIGDGATASQSFLYDEAATPLTANSFARNGYTFSGWNTAANGSGTAYTDGQSVRNLAATGTVNLYAQWMPMNYTISYVLNGGTQAENPPTGFTVESGDITLPTPTRTGGYSFVGWYENADFTGEKVTIIAKGTRLANMTLYAKWGFAGSFTVTNSGSNTFTITRTGDGTTNAQNVGQQTVYFRTVNGSAIGGTHFVSKGGSSAAVTFAEGVTSQTITIDEYSVSKPYSEPDMSHTYQSTAYSNIDRSYALELVKVVGGGLLGDATKVTRTMTKDATKTIDAGFYAPTQINGGEERVSIFFLGLEYPWNTKNSHHFAIERYVVGTASYSAALQYWTVTQADIAVDVSVEFTVLEKADIGFRMTQYNAMSNVIKESSSEDKGKGVFRASLSAQYQPDTGGISAYYSVKGYGLNKVEVRWPQYTLKVNDIREPQQIVIAPMAEGNYKAGETVTISVVFDEIVANANGTTISGANLSGSWACDGGTGSNVLTFTGKLANNCTADTLLNGVKLSGTVLDMANET